MQITPIGKRVLVVTHGGESLLESFGSNAVALLGDEATLLVDPFIAPSQARALADELARRGAPPVRFVVLTHHHTDHAFGAGHFARAGVPVIAHRDAPDRMAKAHPGLLASRRRDPALAPLFEGAEPYAPTVALEGGTCINLGGLSVDVFSPGWCHTPVDLALFARDERLVVAGDLVSVGYHVNMEHASVPGLFDGLDLLALREPVTVVPGHGPVSGPEALAAQRDYHETVAGLVRDGARAGQSDDEIVAQIAARLPGYRLENVLPVAVAFWRRA